MRKKTEFYDYKVIRKKKRREKEDKEKERKEDGKSLKDINLQCCENVVNVEEKIIVLCT